MEIISGARFVHSTPDKLRIMVSMLKNKSVNWAIDQLRFTPKSAAKYLILVLKQIKAQAKDKGLRDESLMVKAIMISEGPKLKRRRICAKGRSTAILKRMSHISIVASDEVAPKLAKTVTKTTEVKEVKAVKIVKKAKTTKGSV